MVKRLLYALSRPKPGLPKIAAVERPPEADGKDRVHASEQQAASRRS